MCYLKTHQNGFSRPSQLTALRQPGETGGVVNAAEEELGWG